MNAIDFGNRTTLASYIRANDSVARIGNAVKPRSTLDELNRGEMSLVATLFATFVSRQEFIHSPATNAHTIAGWIALSASAIGASLEPTACRANTSGRTPCRSDVTGHKPRHVVKLHAEPVGENFPGRCSGESAAHAFKG
jgi:hypothetical protein